MRGINTHRRKYTSLRSPAWQQVFIMLCQDDLLQPINQWQQLFLTAYIISLSWGSTEYYIDVFTDPSPTLGTRTRVPVTCRMNYVVKFL